MLKKVSMTVAIMTAVLVGASVGAQSGAATTARAACADMECDVGILCVENTGGNTYCERQDNTNVCKTKGCAVE